MKHMITFIVMILKLYSIHAQEVLNSPVFNTTCTG